MLINGNYKAASIQLMDLIVNGTATIGDGVSATRIIGNAVINGSLQVNLATFHFLKMNGTATMLAATITDLFKMNGTLHMTDSICEGDMVIHGGAVNMTRCQVRHIHVDVMSFWPWLWRPTIHLNHLTQVNGDIIFNKNAGRVIVKDNAQILGRVINGAIIYK